jgi:hypothetical protein
VDLIEEAGLLEEHSLHLTTRNPGGKSAGEEVVHSMRVCKANKN